MSLLVSKYHFKYGHSIGRECVKSKIRDQYFVFGLENELRTIEGHCITCKKFKCRPLAQHMATLPKYRFEEPLQAFSRTGLDYAGPFLVRAPGRGKAKPKVYILVFSCLQTRAVHFEVTEGVDLSSTMNALSRFVDLRGLPLTILSDNFASFATEDKELESWVRSIDKQTFIETIPAKTEWIFTPPKGPHHGGTYEIMVKAVKRCLKSLTDYSDCSLDEFRTFVSRCAALLNGRPLTRVKLENNDQFILTPNHFLVGNLGGAISTKTQKSIAHRWLKVHHLLNKFWSSFLETYLLELRTYRKWTKTHEDIKIGSLVLEIDPDTPRGQWKLAVVHEIKASRDGRVRQVVVRTTKGLYSRPIVNLVPLLEPGL
jgi:hypothetical protein